MLVSLTVLSANVKDSYKVIKEREQDLAAGKDATWSWDDPQLLRVLDILEEAELLDNTRFAELIRYHQEKIKEDPTYGVKVSRKKRK